MNATSQIGLKEAARMLGKSTRQIMRDIRAGKLHASGGGRGVPYSLAREDVEKFRLSRSGVVNADTLAQIAHAYAMKRKQPQATSQWLNQGFLMLWQWRKNGKEDFIQRFTNIGLPSLSDVPKTVREGCRKIALKLTPAEVDYVAAMFIIRERPLVTHAHGENRSLGVAIQKLNQADPLIFPSWEQFQGFKEDRMRTAWNRIESAVLKEVPGRIQFDAGDTPQTRMQVHREALDGERRIFLDPRCRAVAWQMFNKYCPGKLQISPLLSAYTNSDTAALRSLIVDREDTEGQSHHAPFRTLQVSRLVNGKERMTAPPALLATARKEKSQRLLQGKGKPSSAQVANLLGIHRYQATRLWKGIVQKIGEDGIKRLAEMLMLAREDVPRSWLFLRKRTVLCSAACSGEESAWDRMTSGTSSREDREEVQGPEDGQ